MSVKRIVTSSINWIALAERVPPDQKHLFHKFKAKSDEYLDRMMSYPENPPKIDWSFYKAHVPVEGMVEDFQKQYDALKIPYPPDTVSAEIETLEKELQVETEEFKKESNLRIAEHKKHLKHLNSMIPLNQMTMEDFRDAYPDVALDPINRPTFWPHDTEEQLDYVPPQDQSSGH